MSAQWTFMVYIAGFNNLSPFATKDVNEMRQVGSTDDVKVAVFLKQLEAQSAQHLILGKTDDEKREDLGDVDSGSPQTLLNFIRWAHGNAPAENYALVVWNHGSGWEPGELEAMYEEVRSRNGDTGVTPRELTIRANEEVGRSLFTTTVEDVLALPHNERAIASDDGSGHSLDTIELSRVLAKAHEELGKPLALLGMDACLMSNLEVAYEAQEHVGAVVASEELEPGDGWPYAEILGDLTSNPQMTGEELGKVVVDRYVESYKDRQDQWPVTQCAVEADGIGRFAEALDGLAQALRGKVSDELARGRIIQAQSRSVSFTGELVDLRTFCRALKETGLDGGVQEAASAVEQALEPGSYVLAEGHLGDQVQDCGGVTAYFPSPFQSMSRFYRDLRFAESHGWDEFVEEYASAVRGD
jgi:Clostripain family